MNGGDTLIIPNPRDKFDPHLWVVISEPKWDPAKVVLVNVSSFHGQADRSCILRVGDHPFIKHDTFVFYYHAKCEKLGSLEVLLSRSLIQNHARVTDNVLARIRKGAGVSDYMPNGPRQVLIDQGHI